MIDFTDETPVTLAKARIPGNPAICTRWRWATKGVRGVTLETAMVGGQRFTTQEAVRRFLRRLNLPGSVPEAPNRAAEAADAELVVRGC